jgi:serine/threonine-protein kinase
VVATTPGAGSAASTGTRIVLQVSSGPGEVVVPSVRGLSRADAESALRSVGFSNFQFVSSDEPDGGVAPGQAVGTEPGANTRQAPDTLITVLLNPETD